jgi:hypothetical protein
MADTNYTPDQDKFILDNVGKVSFSNMGAQLERTKHQIRGRYLYLKEKMINSVVRESDDPGEPEQKIEVSVKGDFQTITSNDCNIRTLDELLDYCKVDRTVWEVDSHSVTSYQSFAKTRSLKVNKKEWRKELTRVPLFRIKATLKRIGGKTKAEVQLRESLIEAMDKHAPINYLPVNYHVTNDNPMMVSLNVADHHLAKLCWAPEVGASYDLKIASRMHRECIDDFVGQIKGMPVEKILMPIGNDLFHTDTTTNTTTAGTPQDVDDRWQKMYMQGKGLLVEAIDRLRLIAPVQVVIVPGNHDRQRCFYIGDTLASWYRNVPEVSVDNAPMKRKFVEYGKTLIGFAHLDTERPADLPMQMAITQKAAFARTSHWEWHCGHLHTRRQTTFKPLEVYEGVHVRILPSLCPPDAWHYDNCFNLGPRASEAYIYRKLTGYSGVLVHNPKL